jgi:hypothetical protein
MEGWKVIEFGKQRQAGPANAIEEVAKELDAKKVPYTIRDFIVTAEDVLETAKEVVAEAKKRRVTKKVTEDDS